MDKDLKDYLESLTAKKLNTSDNRLITNSRPDVRARISNTMKGLIKTITHEEKVAVANAAKPTNPEWKAAHTAGIEKRDRPFHTPYGVFPSLNAAARYVTEQGLLTNAVRKFETWKVTDSANYYFEEKKNG